jgi:hypothetical protein
MANGVARRMNISTVIAVAISSMIAHDSVWPFASTMLSPGATIDDGLHMFHSLNAAPSMICTIIKATVLVSVSTTRVPNAPWRLPFSSFTLINFDTSQSHRVGTTP